MILWRTLKGKWMLRYPYTVFISNVGDWELSYNKYNLVLSEDTTSPYSILRVGPLEFFIRPKSVALDFI